MSEEREEYDCCESSAYGFRCTCIKTPYRYSQQAEDDGLGDYLMERERDREAKK